MNLVTLLRAVTISYIMVFVAANSMEERLIATGGRREICLSPSSPMVLCDPGDDPLSFTGYQVELFRSIVAEAGVNWADEDWYFKCMNFTSMINDLTSPTGTCYMSAAAIDVQQFQNSSLVFSWPTYRSGLRILVRSKTQVGGTWSVLKAFHWTVWLALMVTGPLVGVLYWCLESWATVMENMFREWDEDSRRRAILAQKSPDSSARANIILAKKDIARNIDQATPSPGGSLTAEDSLDGVYGGIMEMTRKPWGLQGLQDSIFYAMGPMVAMSWPQPTIMPTRLLMIVWGFLLMIVLNIFWASSATVITVTTQRVSIQSNKDLIGLGVATWSHYVPLLRKQYGIIAYGMPWESQADEEAMLELLATGKVSAVVLDAMWVDYMARDNCSFTAVGESFHSWNQAYAFPPESDRAVIDSITRALIIKQQDDQIMDALAKVYILGDPICSDDGTEGAITFDMISGTWYLLVGSVVFGILYLAIYHAYVKWIMR